MRLRGPRGLELADILRAHVHELGSLGPDKRRVVDHLLSCRTPARGGHLYHCDHCGRDVPLYNSCLDRHCPTCGGLNQVRWVEARKSEVLPTRYFHLVFTLPQALHVFFWAAPALAYGLLFQAVAETLLTLCRANLGFTPAVLCLLHTWTQTLAFHPHLHCIVSGGGLTADHSRWRSARRRFLLPVRVLSRLFKGKLLAKLSEKIDAFGIDHARARALIRAARQADWVVYAKAPMTDSDRVICYLARYTHKTAISNQRLQSLDNGQVTFRYRDRARGNRQRTMTLMASAFLKRFLRHLLPRRFVRVRYYGLLAHPIKKKALLDARRLLAVSGAVQDQTPSASWPRLSHQITADLTLVCPFCQTPGLAEIAVIPPPRPRRTGHHLSRAP